MNSCQPSTPHPPCWHYEYGSATALFVLPRESRARLFSAANGDAADALAATAGDVASLEFSKRSGTGEGARAEDTPVDENGVRDLLQVSWNCCVCAHAETALVLLKAVTSVFSARESLVFWL